MDLYARKVVGWAMSPRMKEDLTKAALDMALRQRRPTDRLVHHSDRGRQGEFNRSSQQGLSDLQVGAP
jgi:putative transposase